MEFKWFLLRGLLITFTIMASLSASPSPHYSRPGGIMLTFSKPHADGQGLKGKPNTTNHESAITSLLDPKKPPVAPANLDEIMAILEGTNLCGYRCFDPIGLVALHDITTTKSVNLTGSYSWQLIAHINNTQNVKYTRTETVLVQTVLSYHSFRQVVQNTAVSANVGLSLNAVVQILTVGVTGGITGSISENIQTMIEHNNDTTTAYTKQETFEVGPQTFIEFYRLLFDGPGINQQTATVSTSNFNLSDVLIVVGFKEELLLENILVVVTPDSVSRPPNYTPEINGGEANINAGYGDKGLWLVPVFTTDKTKAITNIDIAIQNTPNPGFVDLGLEEGGKYRYIVLGKDTHSRNRITDITLYRDDKSHSTPPKGWDKCTKDINEGKKGDFVHICFKFVEIPRT